MRFLTMKYPVWLAAAMLILLTGSPVQAQTAGDPGVEGVIAIVRNFSAASSSSAVVNPSRRPREDQYR